MTGVDFKLSEHDQGELLIKTPVLFTEYVSGESDRSSVGNLTHLSCRYLNNPEATRNAFDEEGFFRTGDIVRYNGSVYEIEGRAECDCRSSARSPPFIPVWVRIHADPPSPSLVIPTFGGRVSAPKIRKALLDLPEVADGHIFAVPDRKYINHVAALVRLRTGDTHCEDRRALNLATLRRALAQVLTEHELPTLLRLVGDEEDIPQGVSGKLMYAKARDQFFPPESASLPEVEGWAMG